MPFLCFCKPETSKQLVSDNIQCSAQSYDAKEPVSIALQPSVAKTQEESRTSDILHQSPQITATVHPKIPKLNDLAIEESEVDEGFPQPLSRRLSKKAGNALGLAGRKLIHHISHNIKRRRRSRISVGNSQEEVDRRAELKRFMHQRIQTELESEESNNASSATSLSSLRYLSPLIDSAVPSTGPRDNIEFTVADTFIAKADQDVQDLTKSEPYIAGDSSHSSRSRKENDAPCGIYPVQPPNSHELTVEDSDGHAETSSQIAALPEPLHIESLSPSFTHSRKSFQLSNSLTRLNRILGPNNGFTTRRDSTSVDGHSTFRVWLIAQGLRTRENSGIHNTNMDPDIPGNDLNSEQRTSTKGVEERISQEIHDQSIEQGCEKLSPRTSLLIPRSSGRKQSNSFEEPTVLHDPTSLSGLSAESCSSTYASKLPSLQPSPARSQQHLHTLKAEDLRHLQTSPYQRDTQSNNSHSQDCMESKESSLASRDPLGTDRKYNDATTYCHPTQLAADLASQNRFETASFRLREAELRSVQRRFSEVMLHRKSRQPRLSRFREEFTEPARISRSDFLAKLYLGFPRRSTAGPKTSEGRKYPASADELNEVNSVQALSSPKVKRPKINSKSSNRSQPCAPSQKGNRELQDETAVAVWQRAFRQEAEQHHGVNGSSNTADCSRSGDYRSRGSVNLVLPRWKGDNSRGKLSTNSTEVGSTRLTPQTDELQGPDRNDSLQWLIQKWVAHMLPDRQTGQVDKDESARIGCPSNQTLPPLSWARFPSNSREQRNGRATFQDSVKPRDFAVKHVLPNGELYWTTNKDLVAPGNKSEPISNSASGRLMNAIKAKFDWLAPSKTRSDQGEQTVVTKRQGSFRAPKLKYPELEILPTRSGYEELEALENEIHNITDEARQSISQEHLSKRPISARSSLVSRVSALMYDTPRGYHEINQDRKATSIRESLSPTPSEQRDATQASPSINDIFVTPQSRLSADHVGDVNLTPTSDSRSIKSEAPVSLLNNKKNRATRANHGRSSTLTEEALYKLTDGGRLKSFRKEMKKQLDERHIPPRTSSIALKS